mmetsp:Transcript_119590/g.298248  ORF Transcript_119590/g.298248 Transcript_119590/m.298248 type:complete len:111 (+) Transcript_119590:2092-2424(+)
MRLGSDTTQLWYLPGHDLWWTNAAAILSLSSAINLRRHVGSASAVAIEACLRRVLACEARSHSVECLSKPAQADILHVASWPGGGLHSSCLQSGYMEVHASLDSRSALTD